MQTNFHHNYHQIQNPILREQYRQLFEEEFTPPPLTKRVLSSLASKKFLTLLTILIFLTIGIPLSLHLLKTSTSKSKVLSAKIEVSREIPTPYPPQIISPPSTSSSLLNQTLTNVLTTNVIKKQIIGFLPYWLIKEEPSIKYNQLTQIAYFGVAFDGAGNIKAQNEDGTSDPGWLYLDKSELNQIFQKAKQAQTKTTLVLRIMDNDDIASLVNDGIKRETFIRKALNLVREKNFDSLNLDFEYAGTPPPVTIKNFTRLARELKEALLKLSPPLSLTIDVFADSAQNERLYDLKALKDVADYLVIMGYDIYRANSEIAAPSAPLGPSHSYLTDYLQCLASFLKLVPPEKLILAVPYYGYEWQTTSVKKNAPTLKDTGALATYKRVKDIIDKKNPQIFWDDEGQTPWLTYQEDGKINQIYFENQRSLALKYDLVNELGLAGVAIWALGYDAPHPELWQLLQEKFPRI
jgi:spore germination protein YaaH